MLRLHSVWTYYRKVQALKGVSLHVGEGELVTLIGANGAGKTTVLNTISGITPAARGSVTIDGEDITTWAPDRIVRAGISQVPEGRQVFGSLSVADNLRLGAYVRRRERGADVEEDLERTQALFPALRERWRARGATLSGGEQQMLAIARALMARPRLLLFDEPSMGLAPMVVKEIFRKIAELRQQGTTILLVEQNARAALRVADRGYVLETGKTILQGTAEELLGNKEVQRAYLGKEYAKVWE